MTDTTPPPELVRHWSRFQGDTNPEALWFRIADKAAQWGADQELEACCDVLEDWGSCIMPDLRAARRPKPPALAEQALEALRSTPCTEQRHYDALFAAINRLKELEESSHD